MNKPKTPEQMMSAGQPTRSRYLSYPTPLDESILVDAMLMDESRFEALVELLEEKCLPAAEVLEWRDSWKSQMYRELPVLLRGLMRRERERSE